MGRRVLLKVALGLELEGATRGGAGKRELLRVQKQVRNCDVLLQVACARALPRAPGVGARQTGDVALLVLPQIAVPNKLGAAVRVPACQL